jgi:hypothetical protein
MAREEEGQEGQAETPSSIKVSNNKVNNKNTALSFLTASLLAVGTLGVAPPMEITLNNNNNNVNNYIVNQQQQQQQPQVITLTGIPSAQAATSATATTDSKKTSPAAAPKVVVKLSKEERERIDSKKQYDLSQQTLKEYQKYVSDVNAAYQKADSNAQALQKQVAAAKNAFIKQSDKLSKAKNDKMPSSAIQELQKETGTCTTYIVNVYCECIEVEWIVHVKRIGRLLACCVLLFLMTMRMLSRNVNRTTNNEHYDCSFYPSSSSSSSSTSSQCTTQCPGLTTCCYCLVSLSFFNGRCLFLSVCFPCYCRNIILRW